MTNTELEQAIREIFLDIYKAEYTGKLWIEKLEPYGYQIKLGLQTPESPLVIYGQLEDKDFLKFFREELKTKSLIRTYYGTLKKQMIPECNNINRACSCNDKGRIN